MNPRRMSTYLRRLTEWVVEPVRVVDEARVEPPNPPCAWCPEPAGEQIHITTDALGRRRYVWLCDECADAHRTTTKETRS